MTSPPSDIIDQLRDILWPLSAHKPYPEWFLLLERQRAHGGWFFVFEGAIKEIERLRKEDAGPELEQMKQLNGRLLRRLADGSDLPVVEAWVKTMEDWER